MFFKTFDAPVKPMFLYGSEIGGLKEYDPLVDMGSLTCAATLVCALHTKAIQELHDELPKC